jgi:hypothetical protein
MTLSSRFSAPWAAVKPTLLFQAGKPYICVHSQPRTHILNFGEEYMVELRLQSSLKHVLKLISGGTRSCQYPRHMSQKEKETKGHMLLGALNVRSQPCHIAHKVSRMESGTFHLAWCVGVARRTVCPTLLGGVRLPATPASESEVSECSPSTTTTRMYS